jgi:hypothetical protein
MRLGSRFLAYSLGSSRVSSGPSAGFEECRFRAGNPAGICGWLLKRQRPRLIRTRKAHDLLTVRCDRDSEVLGAWLV